MRRSTVRHLVASCAFGLVPAVAYGQVGQQLTDQSAAKQNQPGSQNTPPATQAPRAGQVIPQQPGVVTQPGQTGQVQRQVVPGQAGTIIQATPGRVVTGNATDQGSQQESQSLEKLIVNQLKINNQAVIELGQLGVDKAKSDDVKQFAQLLIDDHRKLNQELARFESGDAVAARGDGKRRDQTPDTLPAPNQADQPDVSKQNNRLSGNGNKPREGGSQDPIVSKLTSIAEKASKKHTEMVKEDLQGLEGNEFDMAFVGYQIACHTTAVAKLESMDGVGSSEFQAVVQNAGKKMTSHLDKAKQLAEKLKSDKQGE